MLKLNKVEIYSVFGVLQRKEGKIAKMRSEPWVTEGKMFGISSE
jgi:hypothetical protein